MFRFTQIGPLRILLAVLIVLLIAAAPFADGKVYMHDWRLLPSVVAPSIVMMVVFVLPLDITMTCVFMADAAGEERRRLRWVVLVDVVLFVALIGAWLPFLFKILDVNPLN